MRSEPSVVRRGGGRLFESRSDWEIGLDDDIDLTLLDTHGKRADDGTVNFVMVAAVSIDTEFSLKQAEIDEYVEPSECRRRRHIGHCRDLSTAPGSVKHGLEGSPCVFVAERFE